MMSFDITEKMLSAFLGGIIGYGVKFGMDKANTYFVRDKLIRSAWHFLREPTSIFMPLVNIDQVGAAGGIGDLYAMSDIIKVAEMYFPSSQISVHSNFDDYKHVKEDNLIIIGGGKYNSIYRYLIDVLRVPLHFFDTTTESFSEIRNKERTILYSPEYDENGLLLYDIGLLVRARNPSKQNKWIILVAGSHTYGSAAAMHYLIDRTLIKEISKDLDKNIEVIVRSRIMNCSIANVERISKVMTF